METMKKIIKITTDNEVMACDFPDGMTPSEANTYIYSLIGNGCDAYQTVVLERLYEKFGAVEKITNVPGEAVIALADENGLFRDLPFNFIASYLYKTEIYQETIIGTILIVGLGWDDEEEGIRFMGISDDVFNTLYPQLQDLAELAREIDAK